jgi:hypothetical protein
MYCTSSLALDFTGLKAPEDFDTFEKANENFFPLSVILEKTKPLHSHSQII